MAVKGIGKTRPSGIPIPRVICGLYFSLAAIWTKS
jgi:hypothetical protein